MPGTNHFSELDRQPRWAEAEVLGVDAGETGHHLGTGGRIDRAIDQAFVSDHGAPEGQTGRAAI